MQTTVERFWMAGIALIVLVLTGNSATAQAPQGINLPCHKHSELTRQLSAKYKETPISIGLQSNGNLLQVFASKDSGSWTILSTSPEGLSCILAAGKRWEQRKPVSVDPMT